MLTADEYTGLCARVEAQSVRQLRRYLDYGRRVRQEAGLAQLGQWVGRILLDRDGVYSLDDRALAFGIGACEWLAWHWAELDVAEPEVVTLAGPVDKVLLVRLLAAAQPPARAALAQLFEERYGRTWNWVRERATQLAAPELEPDPQGPEAAPWALFERFLQDLAIEQPLPGDGGAQAEQELAAALEREARLHREVAAVTDRAERAVSRLEALQEEVGQLRRTAREELETSERLREERSRRIRAEREGRDAGAELQRLKAEYLKLDARLREAAQGAAAAAVGPLDLAELRRLDPRQLLGLGPEASPEDLAHARRRFAAAFHSDRAAQLPGWVGDLFDRILSIVNDACDRVRR